jgi:endonuclease/exonuclease/phosphatase family metal-dependent hydrolase
MLFRNKRLPEAVAFVQASNADIFCIHEVPESGLAKFQALYPHHTEAIEMERLFPERPLATYSLVCSRYPIERSGVISLLGHSKGLPWRTNLFIRILRPFGWSRVRGRQALYANIATPSGPVRVIALHLTLTHPSWRLEEFEAAMTHVDPAMPTLVCGDFNILEKPHIAAINWFVGGRISDSLRYTRERMVIEERFASYELTNPLRGQHTHPLSRSQLDHILVSKHFKIESANVVRERHGSDHNPITVELAPL